MTNPNPQTTYLKDYTVPPYLIDQVELDVDLFETHAIVTSLLTIRRNPDAKVQPEALELVGEALELESVMVNDNVLPPTAYSVTDELLRIPALPDHCHLTIRTRSKPQENTTLMGLYKSSGNFCTQCEAEGFRRITYFLDRPDVMARYTTTIRADAKKYPVLLSNGNPVASGNLPEGRHWVRWEDPFKKPSYLFALVAGQLECVEDTYVTQSGRNVKLRIYVESGNQNQCAHAMRAVKKAMKWDEVNYGREYDLDIYMIVAVSDFNMGAMENKGLNIFNTKYILARPETATDEDFIHVDGVIAHEYFHNWTGNRVTCRDWFQLSLKEGLTVFRDQSFTQDNVSKAVGRIQDVNVLRNAQFPEDAGPLAHPVQPDAYIEINNFYTATIYEKGAEVIRMIHTLLGEAGFRKGMDLYFERHDGQAVTIEEFVKAMEDASDVDLKQFRLWYTQAGTPVLDVTDHYDAAKRTYTLTVKQSCPDTPGQTHKKPMHIPFILGLIDAQGKEIVSEHLSIKKPVEEFIFHDLPAQPIPSLLRQFSAPVIVKYAYSDAALEHLFKYDQDEFNRWEAGQKYALHQMQRLIKDYREQKPFVLSAAYCDTWRYVLEHCQTDRYLLAEMLILPSEKYIAEQMDVVDVDAIHAVREFMMRELAAHCKMSLLEVYHQNHDTKPYEFTLESVGKRSLKQVCLAYLMTLKDNAIIDLAVSQFTTALNHNMTDTASALRVLVHTDTSARSEALSRFYDTWKQQALVMDKWFAMQAVSKRPTVLAEVKQLMQHEAFDIKNPNKVYALVGSFTKANPVHFHAIDGSGYQFLTDVVLQLNKINPLVAARMVTPLTSWHRFDPKRQELMQAQLHRLLNEKNLSKDVYELVSKSLHDEATMQTEST